MRSLEHISQDAKAPVSRRRFAGLLGLMGASAIGTAVAPDGVRIVREPATSARQAEHGDAAQADPDAMTVDEMDAMHEAGIASFPAQTEGLGGQPLEY